jgi:hypothetical protein
MHIVRSGAVRMRRTGPRRYSAWALSVGARCAQLRLSGPAPRTLPFGASLALQARRALSPLPPLPLALATVGPAWRVRGCPRAAADKAARRPSPAAKGLRERGALVGRRRRHAVQDAVPPPPPPPPCCDGPAACRNRSLLSIVRDHACVRACVRADGRACGRTGERACGPPQERLSIAVDAAVFPSPSGWLHASELPTAAPPLLKLCAPVSACANAGDAE